MVSRYFWYWEKTLTRCVAAQRGGGMRQRSVEVTQVENGFTVKYEVERGEVDGVMADWQTGTKVFVSYSDLDSWLARFFADGGGDSV